MFRLDVRGCKHLSQPRLASLVPEPSLSGQLLVQQAELPEEAIIGPDFPLLPHRGQSRMDVHVLAKHQKGNDQGWRAAVAFPAVNVDFTCRRKDK